MAYATLRAHELIPGKWIARYLCRMQLRQSLVNTVTRYLAAVQDISFLAIDIMAVGSFAELPLRTPHPEQTRHSFASLPCSFLRACSHLSLPQPFTSTKQQLSSHCCPGIYIPCPLIVLAGLPGVLLDLCLLMESAPLRGCNPLRAPSQSRSILSFLQALDTDLHKRTNATSNR